MQSSRELHVSLPRQPGCNAPLLCVPHALGMAYDGVRRRACCPIASTASRHNAVWQSHVTKRLTNRGKLRGICATLSL